MGFKTAAAGLLIAAFTAMANEPAHAQTAPLPAPQTAQPSQASALKYANSLHLAYIRTSSPRVNDDAQKGLEALAGVLAQRTPVAPAGVVGLDLERDELIFFPFIYWPVTANARELSEQARRKVQNYINTGGVILFDQASALGNRSALERMLGGISIDPLVRMGVDHSLTRAFYLVSGLPGSKNYGTVWVEAPGAAHAENVTAVIIGDSNWAGAWAGRTLPADSRERELAMRAGVDIFMYALTGNYKTDQVHVPSILERLNRSPD